MPQRVPISPQWRMNFCWTGLRDVIASVISVCAEITALPQSGQIAVSNGFQRAIQSW
jgi:hypothetical protein